MPVAINMEKMVLTGQYSYAGGYGSKDILTNEIDGIHIKYTVVRKFNVLNLLPESKRFRVLLLTKGMGNILTDEGCFSITEVAVFHTPLNYPFSIEAGREDLEFIEILYDLYEEEALEYSDKKLPLYYLPYSRCKTYKEAIKSEKTISRTLIAENTIPRFCMGSVQTTGPDIVGAHSHPMLEQLFFGLPGNRCHVTADDAEILFIEDAILHIPLGSNHGVRVEDGYDLHYIWMDFFKSSDMSYISQSHLQDE